MQESPFVGRARELASLAGWLDEARQGRGSLIAVSGEAGIGKTRLLEEFGATVSDAGGRAIRARGRDVPGMPPYWPWIELVRGALDEDQGSDAAHWSAAAHVLLPDRTVRSGGQPGDRRPSPWELVEFLTEALRVAGRDQPLVLVIDDAHWLDGASIRLLHGLAPALPEMEVLLALSYRTDEMPPEHPLRVALAEADRANALHRVELAGIDRDAVQSYVSQRLGEAAARAGAMFERTAGHPYLLRELVAFTQEHPDDATHRRALPAGIRDMLLHRLNAFSADTRERLVAAAVFGPDISIDLWGAVCAAPKGDLLIDVEALLAAHVLEEAGAGAYRFVHALMRDAVLDGISETRLAQLHGAIARTLEARAMEGARVDVSQLAWHFREGTRIDDELAPRAFEYSLEAAEAARRIAAWEPAIDHYTSCLELLPLVPPSDAADEARLLALRGSCYRAAGQGRSGYRDVMAAIELYAARGDWPAHARAALEVSRMWAPSARSAGVLETALAAPGDRDATLEALMVARRARLMGGPADEEMTRARALAGDEVPDALRAELSMYEGRKVFDEGRYVEAAALLREAFELFDALHEPGDAVVAMRLEHDCYLLGGRYRRAMAYYEDCIRYAHRSGQRVDEHVWLGDSGAMATLAGDIALARRRAAEASPEVVYVAYSARIAVAEYTGELEAVADDLPDPSLVAGLRSLTAHVHMHRARALWRSGDELAARREFAEVERLYEGERVTHGCGNADGVLQALASDGFVAGYLAMLEDAPAARAAVWTSLDRMRGTLALRLGQLDEAERHLRRALDWCEEEDVHVEWGRCLADLAEVAIMRGRRSEAAGLLERAIARFRAFGATGYEQSAAARLATLSETAVAPAGLSAREIEVLRLVAAGRTNRQIAEVLVVSPNTVANHVKHILNKTGLQNRAEAAAFAVANGLMLTPEPE